MHAIDQALARYGVTLTVADVAGLCGQIRDGRAVRVRDDGPSVIYLVKWRGVVLVAVWSSDCIKTFLPREYMTPSGQRLHRGVKRHRLVVRGKRGSFRAEREDGI